MRSSWIIRAVAIALILLGSSQAWAGGIRVSFHAATVQGGTSIDVPIYADSSFTGANVTAYSIKVTYSTGPLLFLDTILVTGTLSQAWGAPAFNESSPGAIQIAGAGSTPLLGSGALLILRFKTTTSQYYQYPQVNLQSGSLNEGVPVLLAGGGSTLTIPSTAVVTVSPNSPIIVRGEQQQFTASGGTLPYTWTSTATSVASIVPSTGLATALSVGFTKVVCVDNLGIVDTSGLVEVRGMRVYLRDTSRYQGQTLSLPVYVTTLSGLSITSGKVRLAFDATRWIPQGIDQAGTLTSGLSPLTWQADPYGVNVSFAGITPLSGSGVLFYLKLRASTSSSGGVTFSPQNIEFNEGLYAVSANATISVIARPAVNVTPASAFSMMTGDSVQFSATGGFSPYAWSVSNPAKASFGTGTWLKAHRGGTVTVSATDSVGGVGASGTVSVYDLRLNLPDTTYAGKGAVLLPVYVTGNDTGYNSFQFKVSYPTSNFVMMTGVVTGGTLSAGWSVVTSPLPIFNGNVVIAGASSGTKITTGGILVYLAFTIPDTAVRPSSMSLTLSAPTYVGPLPVYFNEGLPLPLTKNGSIVLSGTASVHQIPEVPSGFSLGQNYPNPFNPSTTITFDIPQRSVVRLTIVNTLGQVVAILVDGEREPGRQFVSWHPTGGSGIYFARLDAAPVEKGLQHYTEVRKMLFLK